MSKWFSIVMVIFQLITFSSLVAAQPKDSPFAVTFTIAANDEPTIGAWQDTMRLASEVGSGIMFVNLWRNPEEFANIASQISVARSYGLKIFLQMAPHERGEPSPPDGLPNTFTSAETRFRYLLDLIKLVELQPDYLVIAPEINLMSQFYPDEFEIFKSMYADIYRIMKALSPDTQVGLSYLDTIWSRANQVSLPDELGPRDYIAFTTYPDGPFLTLPAIPTDWYSDMRAAYPDEPILFTEVGWGSVAPSSESEQADFVRSLSSLLQDVDPTHVIWALLHEGEFFDVTTLDPAILEFLVSVNVDPETLFNTFNSVGIIDQDGLPKPAWLEALDLVFEPTP